MSLTLADIPLGKKVKVITVHPSDLKDRLEDLGMINGALLEVVLAAPWGADPIGIKVRDTIIGLRKSEARSVAVEMFQNETKLEQII